MQLVKLLKVRVGPPIAQQLERTVATEGVTAAEIIRRALVLYFRANPVDVGVPPVEAGGEGTGKGPDRALPGPSPAPPSSSPPSSPPLPPLTPPSLSPPAPLARSLFAETGGPAPPPSPPPVLLFPCVPGRRTAGAAAPQWALSAKVAAEWEETFPGMDVVGEARKARQWLLANHLKTHGGMRTYLFRWLCKAQDSGRFMRRASSRPEGASPRSPLAQKSGTLEEVYGFASWADWEATLRQHFEGSELAPELLKLGEIRARWEAERG